jgi:hypothetical protein
MSFGQRAGGSFSRAPNVHKSGNPLPVCDLRLFHMDVQKKELEIRMQKNTFVIPADPSKT